MSRISWFCVWSILLYKNYLVKVWDNKFHAPLHAVKEIHLEYEILLDEVKVFLLLFGEYYFAIWRSKLQHIGLVMGNKYFSGPCRTLYCSGSKCLLVYRDFFACLARLYRYERYVWDRRVRNNYRFGKNFETFYSS